MHPRILIVGTVPYNKRSTSRAFESYFHNWEKENCAQIFSNTKKPCKGHCKTLYQITDYMMLKRWFHCETNVGQIYNYNDLDIEWTNNNLEVEGTIAQKAYHFGGKHSALTHMLRRLLWRRRFWCTEKLNKWLDEFQPECVFLSFSDDFFIPQIAIYVAKRYNIPIISSIGDDYYFNKHFSLSPIYQWYKESYKALIRKVFSINGSAIYISDKIKEKYNREFGLDGETVYLASEVERKPFSIINTEKPLITYFGNIRMGRNISLNEIGYTLGKLNPNYKLVVYSDEKEKKYTDIFVTNPNVDFRGAIPYTEVQKRIRESDITVVVEGFRNSDIEQSRYSLSTKAADALASGSSILTYGSEECGIVEYMQSTNASAVCTDKQKLQSCIQELLEDEEKQRQYYNNAIIMTAEHHNLVKSCEIFERIVARAIERNKNAE